MPGLASSTPMVPLLHPLERRKRMATYSAMLILAAATLATQSANAQDQLGRERVVKVSGCIAQAPRTGSLTDDSGAGNVPSPNTAGVEANSSEPVNAYILLDATPVRNGGAQQDAESGPVTPFRVPPRNLPSTRATESRSRGNCSLACRLCPVRSRPRQRYNASRCRPSRCCPRSVNLRLGDRFEERSRCGLRHR